MFVDLPLYGSRDCVVVNPQQVAAIISTGGNTASIKLVGGYSYLIALDPLAIAERLEANLREEDRDASE